MAFGQGGEVVANVNGSTVGAATTFSFRATLVYVRNTGTSDVFVSLATTSGTTDGHPIQTLGERYFTSSPDGGGGFYGISYITTAAGSTAGIKIIALR